MKKIPLVSLVLFLILSIGFCFTGCADYVTQQKYENADAYAVGDQTYNSEVTTLNVDWLCGSLTLIEKEDATEITLKETGSKLSDKTKMRSYLSEGVLDVKFWKSGYRSTTNDCDKDLVITLPSVRYLNLKLTSGKFSAEKLTAKVIHLTMTSGSATVGDLSADEITLIKTSGSTSVRSLSAKEATVQSSSGKFAIRKCAAENFSSDLTSGELDVDFLSLGSAEMRMTSGTVRIGLPSGGATIDVRKTTGEIKTSLDYEKDGSEYLFGKGESRIEFHMTSGTLRVANAENG